MSRWFLCLWATAYLILGVSERFPVLLVYGILYCLYYLYYMNSEHLHLVNVYIGYNCFYLPCNLYHLSINSWPQNVVEAYFWPAVLLLQTLVEYYLI